MPEDKIILSYKGNLTYDTIGDLLGRLKEIADSSGISLLVYKRVLGIMIESLENIYKYFKSLNNLELTRSSFENASFLLEFDNSGYLLEVGNIIRPQDVEHLTNRIDEVNSYTRDELKLQYRQIINNGQFSEKGGAGLGLIEIARMSGHPIQYMLQPLDSNYSFIVLKVRIPLT
jgi:hypothetical protein